MGSFNNHVDRFLPFFDYPPTPSGQTWTFGLPPTLCPRGHPEIATSPTINNMCLLLHVGRYKTFYICNIWPVPFQYYSVIITNTQKSNILKGKKYFFVLKNEPFWYYFVTLISRNAVNMSTWTLNKPPTHLTWTNVDIWLTTYPPLLVHVVIECPLVMKD